MKCLKFTLYLDFSTFFLLKIMTEKMHFFNTIQKHQLTFSQRIKVLITTSFISLFRVRFLSALIIPPSLSFVKYWTGNAFIIYATKSTFSYLYMDGELRRKKCLIFTRNLHHFKNFRRGNKEIDKKRFFYCLAEK